MVPRRYHDWRGLGACWPDVLAADCREIGKVPALLLYYLLLYYLSITL